MKLSDALRLGSAPRLAFIGAGGKSTAIFKLARELSPALVSSTTHLGTWQASLADRHFLVDVGKELPNIKHELGSGVTLITGAIPTGSNRILGLSKQQIKKIYDLAEENNLPLLIEADGSHQRPLKAPDKHEPAIPDFVDMVVVVAGLSSIGKPLSDEFVHRPKIYSTLSKLSIGDPITLDAVVKVLTDPQGGLKNIPLSAKRVVLLTQVDNLEILSYSNYIAKRLIPTFHSIVVTTLDQSTVWAVHEPTSAIILAAGESTRMGQPKQLLEIQGQSIIRIIAHAALSTRLSPVIVVTGAYAKQISESLHGLPVQIVHNANYQLGQSSSLQAGLHALPAETGAVIFLLADQPQVTPAVLDTLVEAHATGFHSIHAPMVDSRRANPVLFDRRTFTDLMSLKGDAGGRGIFNKYPVESIPWYDDRLLLDIDTIEDYQRALDMLS